MFGILAGVVCLIDSSVPYRLSTDVTPFEFAGAALSVILVLRTNAGYDRWWEGRRLWGGIVNQCRNLGVAALAYGPEDPAWRQKTIRWVAAFPHALRLSLRGETINQDDPHDPVVSLVGAEEAGKMIVAGHQPTFVASRLAALLQEGARATSAANGNAAREFSWIGAETQRALLIDHAGGCERIQNTPLPLAYSIHMRRFLFLFFAVLPFGLITRMDWWATPLVTMLIAYPVLALDEIGAQLQQPFSKRSLNHLPLDEICANVEANLLCLLDRKTI